MEDITIPEGYDAKIEGNKVVFVEKESEDERIRERIIQHLISIKRGSVICTIDTSEEIAWLKRQKAAEWLAHFDKQKEHKPAGQDYSGLSEFERAIHRGFLCAGVENVPVSIIKDTAKECLEAINPASDGSETLTSMKVPRRPNIPPVPKPIIAGEADEKIRKELIEFLREAYSRGNAPEECAKWLVYLDKPVEWSEKDERVILDACCWLAEYAGFLMSENKDKAKMLWGLSEKLKSLRPQPKQEWNEEDEKMKTSIVMTLASFMGNGEEISWLKSLPERFK